MRQRAAMRRALRKGLLDERLYPVLRALCARALKKYGLVAGFLLALSLGMLYALFHVSWPEDFIEYWSRVYIAAAANSGMVGLVMLPEVVFDALAVYRLRGVEPAALPPEERWLLKIPLVKALHRLWVVKRGSLGYEALRRQYFASGAVRRPPRFVGFVALGWTVYCLLAGLVLGDNPEYAFVYTLFIVLLAVIWTFELMAYLPYYIHRHIRGWILRQFPEIEKDTRESEAFWHESNK